MYLNPAPCRCQIVFVFSVCKLSSLPCLIGLIGYDHFLLWPQVLSALFALALLPVFLTSAAIGLTICLWTWYLRMALLLHSGLPLQQLAFVTEVDTIIFPYRVCVCINMTHRQVCTVSCSHVACSSLLLLTMKGPLCVCQRSSRSDSDLHQMENCEDALELYGSHGLSTYWQRHSKAGWKDKSILFEEIKWPR